MNLNGQGKKVNRRFLIIFLLVSIPVFLINLGEVPFIEDEGIRGLVALEMQHSGNYISPTLYGEYYYKKPPLWNWFVLLSYNLTGIANEFTTRLPTIFFLLCFSLSIYLCTKKYLGEQQAILNALFLLTCGRILFWDSMLGLIDILFSWVIFLLFIWIYHFHQKKQLLAFYLGAYTLVSIAFMLKALPSLVFLVLSLATVHSLYKSWRWLVSWQHLCGVLILSTVLGAYLLAYSKYQPVEELLSVFVNESTQRTAIEHGFISSLKQLVTFPVEMIYHFLPWSLLSLLFFQRNIKEYIKQQPFLAYCSAIFLVNIFVYWTSPEVFPRYLFMFAPLYFAICIYLYFQRDASIIRISVDRFLLLVSSFVLIGSVYVFFNEHTSRLTDLPWRWLISVVPMAVSLYLMTKFKSYRLHSFCVFLLAARLGFSLIVLPVRASRGVAVETREDCFRVARQIGAEELKIYDHDSLRYEVGFYLTTTLGKTLSISDQVSNGSFMLVNPSKYATLQGQFAKLDSIRVPRKDKYVYLIKDH